MEEKNNLNYGYLVNKEENPFCMTRKEFDDKKKKHKNWNNPYEFYRIFLILNHEQQKRLLVFMRENNNPVDIIKECAKMLEEESSTQE